MRVLHFLPVYIPAWHYGGPVLSVSRLCEGLAEHGVDVRVVTTNAGLPEYHSRQLATPQTVNGVTVFYYPLDSLRGPIRSKALVDSLPEHMSWADLLHLSSIWQPLGSEVQRHAYKARVPVIQSLRGALGPYSWRRGLLKKTAYFLLCEMSLLQQAAALHCTTCQEAREIRWLRLRAPVQVLANPIDLSQLHTDPLAGQAWRELTGLPGDQPLLLVAGRIHHKKGLELLPEVLKSLAHKPWHIMFVGKDDDGTGRRLRRAFSNAGLAERCHWIEALPADQLLGPYNAADWLLLPSRHENFGNVVVEALACGCGVLISDRVGVSESLDCCPGVRVVHRNKASWIEQLSQAFASSRPGAAAEAWVKQRFSQQLIARQAIDLYAGLLFHG